MDKVSQEVAEANNCQPKTVWYPKKNGATTVYQKHTVRDVRGPVGNETILLVREDGKLCRPWRLEVFLTKFVPYTGQTYGQTLAAPSPNAYAIEILREQRKLVAKDAETVRIAITKIEANIAQIDAALTALGAA